MTTGQTKHSFADKRVPKSNFGTIGKSKPPLSMPEFTSADGEASTPAAARRDGLPPGMKLHKLLPMSMTEILEELPRLARVEREKVWQRLEEIELGEIEETPEVLAAIDEGRQSIREGKTTTVEEARKLVARWTIKSS